MSGTAGIPGLVVADGREKGCKRTLLKESIKVIGKLPAYCLVAVEDSKREGLMKDNAVPNCCQVFQGSPLERVQTVPR